MNEAATRIFITEYMTPLNKGDLELIEGILKSLTLFDSTQVSIFSFYPAFDKRRYSPNVKLIDICKDLRIGRYLRGATTNGDLLASFSSGIQHLFFIFLFKLFGKNALKLMKGKLWHEYYSADALIVCMNEDDCVNGNYLWFSSVYISLLARALGKLAVTYANSNTKTTRCVWIWRFRSEKIWNMLARYFVNNMNLITTRDKTTFKLYKSLARSEIPVYFTGDVGILLEPATSTTVQEIMIKERIDKKDQLIIGATITRRLLIHAFQNYPELERYEKGITIMAEVFDRLITEYQSSIVFLPHCIEFNRNNDDRLVGFDIHKKMNNKNGFKVISNEYSPKELKGLIGKLDVFVGDRIHALISALSMGVPCCTLSYSSDRRPYNLIGEDFKQDKWIFEVDTFEADSLFRLIVNLIAASSEIRKNLPSITQRLTERAMLNGQLLKDELQKSREIKKQA